MQPAPLARNYDDLAAGAVLNWQSAISDPAHVRSASARRDGGRVAIGTSAADVVSFDLATLYRESPSGVDDDVWRGVHGDGARTGTGSTAAPFVAVEGPTGVGKTTLVHRVAGQLCARVFLDPVGDSPFLRHLYGPHAAADAVRLGICTELTFLALRVAQLREIREYLTAGGRVPTDWAMCKSAAFAALTLALPDQKRLASTVAEWTDDLPCPDLLVHLRAGAATLAARVRSRARQMEADLRPSDPAALSKALARVLAGGGTPVLEINAATLDLSSAAALRGVVDRVRSALDGVGVS